MPPPATAEAYRARFYDRIQQHLIVNMGADVEPGEMQERRRRRLESKHGSLKEESVKLSMIFALRRIESETFLID